jgi:hypothetical protein
MPILLDPDPPRGPFCAACWLGALALSMGLLVGLVWVARRIF